MKKYLAMEDCAIMKEQEAISYLDSLERGNFIIVNIPILEGEDIPVTAMYIGKDYDNRYVFADTGKLILTKDFIEKGKITIDKEFDGEKAMEIYSKIKLEQRTKINRDRETR